jgi:hydroxymethylpyrimidine/phosphomethylpyrimidine kinase
VDVDLSSAAATVIAVGGLDPTGGAGLVRDFLTARALGGGAVLVGTAFTDQSSRTAAQVYPRGAAAVATSLRRALSESSGQVAVKVGMTATSEIAAAITGALAGFRGPVVFDPVLAASSGGSLFVAGRPADLLALARRATLCTPNLSEAEAMTGHPVQTLAQAYEAARLLTDAGVAAVLIKGGHLPDSEPAVDLLRVGSVVTELSGPRMAGPGLRGTGCALATAIALYLAAGAPLAIAVPSAKAWLAARIAEHAAGS